MTDDHDSPARERRSSSGRGQGRVKDPAQDGRLKRNKALGISKGAGEERKSAAPGGQGRVKDPARDGRLKENRETP